MCNACACVQNLYKVGDDVFFILNMRVVITDNICSEMSNSSSDSRPYEIHNNVPTYIYNTCIGHNARQYEDEIESVRQQL